MASRKSSNASRTFSREARKTDSVKESTQLPACAECRRVKRRCNRKWPCQSCIRRGCASICPDGTLTPGGGGNRYILHGSEQLHRKIKDMSTRIAQLEDALAALWARVGEDDHPLLRGDLMAIKLPPDTQNYEVADPRPPSDNEQDDEDELEEDLLESDLHGLDLQDTAHKDQTERLGISTMEFRLASREDKKDPASPSTYRQSPILSDRGDGTKLPIAPTVFKIAETFPSAVPSDSMIDLSTLLLYLPPLPLALRLTKSYFDNAAWTCAAINRMDFAQEVLPMFYNIIDTSPNVGSRNEPPGIHKAHELALLYMVFAIGAIVDLTQPSVADQAPRYNILAKTAVCLDSPLRGGSITLVQVLCFMTNYAYMWEQNEVNMDQVAMLMALASKLGLSLGLHRDRQHDQLGAKEVHRRRWVFWELLTGSAWQCLSSGCPPTIQLSHADCQLPNPADEASSSGKLLHHPHDFYKFKFTRECLWPIIDSNFNLTKPVNYQSVLALDRKVREFKYPAINSEVMSHSTLGMKLQTHISSYVKEHVMLHLHRACFSRAMTTHPDSPNDSPYASSFLAIFKCAVTLLESCKTIYEQLPSVIIPYGLFWTDVLMSAVAMGTICYKGPRGSFAPLAYEHLNVAVQIAEAKFAHLPRSQSGLPILYRIRQRAHTAIAAVGPQPTNAPVPPGRQARSKSRRMSSTNLVVETGSVNQSFDQTAESSSPWPNSASATLSPPWTNYQGTSSSGGGLPQYGIPSSSSYQSQNYQDLQAASQGRGNFGLPPAYSSTSGRGMELDPTSAQGSSHYEITNGMSGFPSVDPSIGTQHLQEMGPGAGGYDWSFERIFNPGTDSMDVSESDSIPFEGNWDNSMGGPEWGSRSHHSRG